MCIGSMQILCHCVLRDGTCLEFGMYRMLGKQSLVDTQGKLCLSVPHYSSSDKPDVPYPSTLTSAFLFSFPFLDATYSALTIHRGCSFLGGQVASHSAPAVLLILWHGVLCGRTGRSTLFIWTLWRAPPWRSSTVSVDGLQAHSWLLVNRKYVAFSDTDLECASWQHICEYNPRADTERVNCWAFSDYENELWECSCAYVRVECCRRKTEASDYCSPAVPDALLSILSASWPFFAISTPILQKRK